MFTCLTVFGVHLREVASPNHYIISNNFVNLHMKWAKIISSIMYSLVYLFYSISVHVREDVSPNYYIISNHFINLYTKWSTIFSRIYALVT